MGRDIQHRDDNTTVKVGAGYDRDHQTVTTDFIIADRTSDSGAHEHVVISEGGDVLHDTTGSL